MLGQVLDRVFGEDAEATANDAAESHALVNRNAGREIPVPSLVSQRLAAIFCFVLLRPVPEKSSNSL